MALYEWIPSIDSSKAIIVRNGKRGSSAYGTVRRFDQVAPVGRVNFSGEGFSTAEMIAIKDVHETASDGADAEKYTLVDFQGNTWVGGIVTFRAEPISGTGKWSIEISMDEYTFTSA